MGTSGPRDERGETMIPSGRLHRVRNDEELGMTFVVSLIYSGWQLPSVGPTDDADESFIMPLSLGRGNDDTSISPLPLVAAGCCCRGS